MKKIMTLVIVALAMFMESVDTTVLNTAIPVMAQHFNVNPINLKLALISYLLSLAVFIPISGWIGDRFGIKKVFMIAVTIFTLSSLACGMTQDLTQLVITRMLQGLGGSLTLPIGRLIVIRTYERHELISKMSVVVMVASFGMMLGPLLGGIISYHMSWRWIFWINIPIGACILVLSSQCLPTLPTKTSHPLDKLGFIIFGSSLAILTLGLSLLSESHINFIYPLLMITSSIVLFLLYAYHSHGKEHPVINAKLFKIRTFRISLMGNLIARIGFGGIPFLLPLLLQVSLHFSSEQSGFLLAPIAIGVLVVKPMSLFLLRQFGYKKLLFSNTLCIGISLCSFMLIHTHSSFYTISLFTFFYGFFIALQYTAMNSLAYADIAPENISDATSIMSTIQQLAQSFGVAIAAIIIMVLSPTFSIDTSLTLALFRQTFAVLCGITLLSIIIFMQLEANDGQALIHVNA